MSIETSFAACEDMVKRFDPDRYYSALFAPAERRPLLFALYAFNHEIARVAESVREPMLGEIRLQWWREAVESARDGHPRAHDVVRALAELFASVGPPIELFAAMIEARSLDAANETFADMVALESYYDKTSGMLMRVAALVLVEEIDDLAREAGIAYGLTGLLRAIPFHASRGKLYLPLDMIVEAGLSADEIVGGQGGAGLKVIVEKTAAHARNRLAAARALSRPNRALPALLPASLVPAYLKLMTKPGFNPFRDPAELPLWRRQLVMMVANVRGRI